MKKFLVLMSDRSHSGRGVRGRTLYCFLKTFLGRQGVALSTPDELLSGRGTSCDTLFVGLPTSLDERHLLKLRHRRMVLFDMQDTPELYWEETNREFLSSHADLYLKTWVDRRWRTPIRMGTLPLRRHIGLTLHLRSRRVLARIEAGRLRDRPYDATFYGTPNARIDVQEGNRVEYRQRVEWLKEIADAGSQVSFRGGLTHLTDLHRHGLEAEYGNISSLFLQKSRQRVPFRHYFGDMLQSKVVLAPSGNAPWSYRHYEGIYSGAAVVSTDFEYLDTLIPLPWHNMVQVPDGAPVLPAIEKAIHLYDHGPERLVENLRFLEQYLHYGNYSKRKPKIFERFLEQLESGLAEHKAA